MTTNPSAENAIEHINPSAEAVMKSSECCDNAEDLYSEAVRTECWTKPTLPSGPRTTLSCSTSAVNTWPNLEWPTYVPSTGSTLTTSSSSSASSSGPTSFSPNISVPMCPSSHKENLFQIPNLEPRSTQIGELYESFVHKRAFVKYQSQSELIKVML